MNKDLLVKFKDFATVNPGQSPKSEFYSFSKGLPFLQGNRTFGLLYPTIDTYTTKVTKTAEKGEILMSVRAPVGDLNFAKEKVCIGRGVASINAKDGNNQFLFYCLKYNIQNLIRQGGGTTYDSVNKDVINDFDLIMPPTKIERKIIAKVLSDLDAKIEVNNKINQELEAMAKTLYDYWFVQFDFPFDFAQGKPDANGRPYKSSGGKMVFNEALKRQIPKGWEDGVLTDIANITMGQSPSGSSYNENGEGTVFYQGSTDFGSRFPTVRKYTTEPSRMAEENDILLSVRAPVGTLNQAMENCCIGRGLAALREKEGSISFLWSQMEYFKQIFDRRNSSGTTFGSITKNDLFNLKLCIPNKDVLEQFKKIADPFHERIVVNSKENQKLSELRDWLLPMLMNGQVTVGEAEQELGMVAEERESYK